ncbi:MAG: hypothetical protein AB8H03_20710 [Saprospiraceae bacterium]
MDWFTGLSKEELPAAYDALGQARNDAINIVEPNLALLWLFLRHYYLVDIISRIWTRLWAK